MVLRRVRCYAESQSSQISSDSEIDDPDSVDDEQDENINNFMSKPCGCKRNCHTCFSMAEVKRQVYNVREMTKDEKELHVMALLSDSNQETQRGKKRVRTRQSYSVNGKLVCKSAFLILMDISNYTLKTLKKTQTLKWNFRQSTREHRSPPATFHVISRCAASSIIH